MSAALDRYAMADTATLAQMAVTDRSAHATYCERMAYRDAIEHALADSAVWDEVTVEGDPYSDPEATGPIATAELSALLAPIGRA